jgi:cystathionine gamma-synthase
MHPSTRAARAPGRPESTFGALTPSIIPSTTYVRDEHGDYPGGHSYSRDQNPTGEPAEQLLAELEGGHEAMLFASGMAAATALFDAVEPGTHVVAPRQMYWTIRLWLERQTARGALHATFVDATEPDAWTQALAAPPAGASSAPPIVWLETPSNPMLAVTDLGAVAAVAHDAGALVVADNTTATPVHTRPIEHGVDVVFHSATKQLNGHADVLAGALVSTPSLDVWPRIRDQRAYRGAVLGPFEAWLLLRGMRTLFVRVPRASDTAQLVAEHLRSHPAVTEVLYPGLADHPHHDVAARLMDGGFGLLVSMRVRGGEAAARRVMRRLELFADATSLGGTESLVEHRSRVEGEGSPVPSDLLRLAIGIEDADDLLADLTQALDAETDRTDKDEP